MNRQYGTPWRRPFAIPVSLRIASLLLCALGATGCASVYSVTHGPEHNDVFGGVRLDGRIIGAAVTDGRVHCGLENCEQGTVWWLSGPALGDLPFSLVLDTVLLPYTLVAADISDPSDPSGQSPRDRPQ